MIKNRPGMIKDHDFPAITQFAIRTRSGQSDILCMAVSRILRQMICRREVTSIHVIFVPPAVPNRDVGNVIGNMGKRGHTLVS